MNNYTKTMFHRLARANGILLTQRHEEILEFVYRYYQANRVGPLYFNLKRHLGVNREEVNLLFPHGLNSVYHWVGIPVRTGEQSCKPTAAVNVESVRDIYLDHNATTYLREEVSELLAEYHHNRLGFANPSSSTLQGKNAYDQVFQARSRIAGTLGVEPEEIIFTGSGSEANNLAIKGIAFQHLRQPGHIVTSNIEHSSVLETMSYLETLGFEVTRLPAGPDGRLSVRALGDAIRPDTILVSVMTVNNEIGTIQPIEEMSAVCRERKIPMMTDAIQAYGRISLKPRQWGLSLLSISGHKIYAPKGIGALFLDCRTPLIPLIHGKSQEFGLRAGTENVGHILAFGLAAELAERERERERQRILGLRNFFLAELKKIEPEYLLNGSLEHRIVHNLNISFPRVDTAALLLSLNSIGICTSAGSACSSGKLEASSVLMAIGADTEKNGTIRFSFGLKTSREDLEYLFRYLPEILIQIREV